MLSHYDKYDDIRQPRIIKGKYLILGPDGRYAGNDDMKVLLGIKPTAHLPIGGMPIRKIQGIEVYVKAMPPVEYWPKDSAWPTKRRKMSGHRIMAICPECARHISAGRLFQHVCSKEVKDAKM